MTYLLAGIVTFPITAALTIAGVGAAFVLIPIFLSLGIELRQAMAIALLLNGLGMVSASVRYTKKKLVLWKLSLPMVITSSIGAPLGVRIGYLIDSDVITVVFIGFLLFAAAMIFFSHPHDSESTEITGLTVGRTVLGAAIGLFVGLLAGLIGVGGGNIILPILLALKTNPREAVATTAVVVVFTSLFGFVSHVGTGSLDPVLVLTTAGAAIAGGIAGSWLMTDKLNPATIKKVLGVVLIGFAIRMIVGLF